MLALALFVPGPNDPVCESWQTVEVDHCVQGQLPEETIGRQMDEPAPAPTEPPDPGFRNPGSPRLAHTGVVEQRYIQGAGVLIVSGAILRLTASRRARR